MEKRNRQRRRGCDLAAVRQDMHQKHQQQRLLQKQQELQRVEDEEGGDDEEEETQAGQNRGSVIIKESDDDTEEEDEERSGSVIIKDESSSDEEALEDEEDDEDAKEQRAQKDTKDGRQRTRRESPTEERAKTTKNERDAFESESDSRQGSVIVHEEDEDAPAKWKEPEWSATTEGEEVYDNDGSDDSGDSEYDLSYDGSDSSDRDEDGDEAADVRDEEDPTTQAPDSSSRDAGASGAVVPESENANASEGAWAQKVQRRLKKQVWMKEQKKKRTAKSVLIEEEDFLWQTLDRFEVEKKAVETRRRLRNERRQGVIWQTAPIPELAAQSSSSPSPRSLATNSLKIERPKAVSSSSQADQVDEGPTYDPLLIIVFPEHVRPKVSEPRRGSAEQSASAAPVCGAPIATVKTITPETESTPSDPSPSPLSTSSPRIQRSQIDGSPQSLTSRSPSASEGSPKTDRHQRKQSASQPFSILPFLPPINFPSFN